MDQGRRLGLALLVAGCAANGHGHDVTGPFTGDVQRFAIDSLVLPHVSGDAIAFADDLDGDGMTDDRIGAITETLAMTMDLSVDVPSMIAGGSLASSVTIQADDLTTDDSVGVTYFGHDGDAATVCGGKLAGGAYLSNRTHDTSVPGAASLRLPVFTNADPMTLELQGVEIDLDPDGTGGYDGVVRGGIAADVAAKAAYDGLVQMILDEPQRHLVFARLADTNHDGQLSRDEIDASVIGILLAPDIQLFDGTRYAPNPKKTTKDSLSLAFRIHLVPCRTGTCATAPPPDACRDRIRDAGETDIDCGGPCQPCQAGATCSIPADCQTGACGANRCAPASCSDGVRDGLETDVDCGDNCPACQLGQTCATGADCASGHCNNQLGSLGVCS